ncbi:hypothetical protein BGZ95_009334 [Linnemannia exigua]|uniref:Uncharacterized protein n=1 Tax=Linnemannia exigua TaxID=604196 RepID=A0AAD4DCZ9_9FUNG|nr:hypothetical protein BGZ95_009334 [Linnemannia exigua]
MPKNTPTATPYSNSTTRANEEEEVTAASILLQGFYSQSDPFKTIAHLIANIHSRIDIMAVQIHSNTERIENLTLTLIEHSRRLDQLPQPSLNDTTAAAASVTPVAAPAASHKNANGLHQSVTELDEMKKQIEHNSQGIQALTAWLNEKETSEMTSAAIGEGFIDGNGDDEEEDYGIAGNLEDEQQDLMVLGQDDSTSVTRTELDKDERRRNKGKQKSRAHDECAYGVLKREDVVEEMAVGEYPEKQLEVYEEDDISNRAEPGSDVMASLADNPLPPKIFVPEHALRHLFDQVANLYTQPTQETAENLASHYEFSSSMPKTLDEIWKLWFVSEANRPSIWSLETMVDNWRFRYSSGQVGNYHRQNAVIYNVLEQLYHIDHDRGDRTITTRSSSNNNNKANVAAITFRECVDTAKARVEAEINDAGSVTKYASTQYKELCIRRRRYRSHGPHAKRART